MTKQEIAAAVKEHMRKLAAKGGRSTSAAKRRASKENFRKANAKRWAGKKKKGK